jgi:hypothetical protein
VRDSAAAEDVAQDAFVALARGASSFERGRPFGPWFRTLVLNVGDTTMLNLKHGDLTHIRYAMQTMWWRLHRL